MGKEINLGELLYDSHPKYKRLLLLSYLNALIAYPLAFYGIIIGNKTLSIIVIIISLFIWFPLYYYVRESARYGFKIYQYGMVFNDSLKGQKPLKEDPMGGHFRAWKKIVRYEDIVSIHPRVIKLGKSKYMNNISLIFVLPKEKGNYIVGRIVLNGSKMGLMPEIINSLKSQMGSLWEEKYKRDEPLKIGNIDVDKVSMTVEMGENP